MEVEFGENPFEELLTRIGSENPPTDTEVRSVLTKGVPKDFGPSEESFRSLLEEIKVLKSWREKMKKPSIAVPFDIRIQNTSQDSITLIWVMLKSDKMSTSAQEQFVQTTIP